MTDKMTVREVAELAEVTTQSVLGALWRKTLAGKKEGGGWVIRRADGMRYVKRAKALRRVMR